MNNFDDSQIPSEVSHLKKLKSLNLSQSGFSGQIPNEISQMIHLSSLDLSSNALKLHSPNGLKTLLQNLTELEDLHLSGVEISSFVPHFLANFSSLRSIKLQDCSLQNKFPEAIFHLQKLKFLDLSFNAHLAGSFHEFRNNSILETVNLRFTSFSGTIPESIINLNHLTFLCLTNCSFSGHIPRSLSNMTRLTKLCLGLNKFTGFVPSLESLPKLTILELSDNKFEKGCLPNWLGMLSELNELRAYRMNLNCEIPPFIANITQLRLFAIGINSFTGQIPSWLFNLTQLTKLDLQQNHLEGPISSSFSKLKTLQSLHLGKNNFSGSVNLDMFLGLNELELLILGDNKISLVETTNYNNTTLPQLIILDLSKCNLKEFPAFLRIQNRIENLELKDNKIGGMVPVWIWNNSKETLQFIDLSNNFITGFQKQPRFFPWEHLEVFSISNNQVRGQLPIPPQSTVFYTASSNNLTGEISPLICELKSLEMIDFSSNNMSGTLPPCFGNLRNLMSLDIGGNNFHGIMMNGFRRGSQLKSIELSDNQFTGRLPKSLSNCTKLEFLSLSDNSFNDVFPSWLGDLSNLQVLVLRSNKFYGPIEYLTTISSQFSKLRIIDLSNNDFSGQLHRNYFQSWNSIKSVFVGESIFAISKTTYQSFSAITTYIMTLTHKGGSRVYNQKILTIFTYIDLSCNHFEGEIPLSLQELLGLESLNLSHNHFTGRVLPSVGYLKNLESLDLSHNNLSGEIPQQLVQLNFLEIFNVSFNHLHGHIPRGQQFNTFENDSYMGNPGLCGPPL